jgi:cation-transporting P-type ATPase 13A2
MLSMVALSLFNVIVLLSPPQPVVVVLELMFLPRSARGTLLTLVLMNVVLSAVYERWGSGIVAGIVGRTVRHWRRTYKAVEGIT